MRHLGKLGWKSSYSDTAHATGHAAGLEQIGGVPWHANHCHGGSPPELSFFLGRTSFPRTSGPSGLVSFPWDSLLLSTEFRLFVCASLEI